MNVALALPRVSHSMQKRAKARLIFPNQLMTLLRC